MSFKKLTSRYISNHQYFTAREDSYETAGGKKVDAYFVVELPASACAMAITENNEVVLVNQFRYPVEDNFIELPGGFIDEGEHAQQGIARELLEETGYSFSSIQYLGMTAANPGVLNNYTHMFLALGGKKTAEQTLDNNEEIEIMLKPLDEVRRMLDQHEIKQAMHALCLFYGFQFLEKNIK
ncbi:NUDIX hydrolase [Ferruginibacter sp. HRS2-29]|uniref:NUDIX hydrolase n=1 Tax=Ferruginibacter sp. HRS2-29 TaxID=2487334 RepID=UPI0020CB6E5E|nr:NUDIX hydrolase [Ferruginibacter sp. HRS2-29]MCP9753369.1 NUDIX hydrolase [Ferruginibacter sp. HRS2-29]